MAVQSVRQLQPDGPQEGFISFLNSLPEKPATTVRFFDRGEYYTLHGADAIFAAKEIFKTTSVTKTLGAGQRTTESLSLSRNNFEAFTRELLLVKQYRIEVYQNQSTSKSNDWILISKASPGNITQFEELLFGNTEQTISTGILGVKIGTENDQRLMSNEDNFHQYYMSTFDLSLYMRLDGTAVQALHLLPSTEAQPTSVKAGSAPRTLLALLNKCRTAAGQRLLAQWIKQPLLDKKKIEERLDLVETFVADSQLRQTLSEEYLKRIPDMQRLGKKFLQKNAGLQDCFRVYQAILKLPALVEVLEQHDGKHLSVLKAIFTEPLRASVLDFEKFKEMVLSTVDLALAEQGEYLVKADFDDELLEFRERMQELEASMNKLLLKVAHDLDLEAQKTLKLENNNQFGYFFRVTLKEEKTIRNNRNYSVIDSTKAGARFRNSALTELNEEYLQVHKKYEEQQKSVVDEILVIAAGYSDPLRSLNDILARLDVFVALATAAVNAPLPYVRPCLLEKGSGKTVLKELRHPCLELQENISFIPNDAEFDKSGASFHIITGPNMGGKSTYLRSVGLAVLMAQLGSFVPCSEATVSLVDSILARVGAGDCQVKGVSTFMAEMLDTSYILRVKIAIRKSSALTTNNSLTLLYRVRPGICDQSFGLHVAELVQFPEKVLQEARQKAAELEDFQAGGLYPWLAVSQELGSEEPANKKAKLDAEEEESRVNEFLREAKTLVQTAQSDEELVKAACCLECFVLGKHTFFAENKKSSRSKNSLSRLGILAEISNLQKEVFAPTDERLVGVVHVTKANKKKKTSFLCVAISHDKNSCATLCQVKKTDKNVYKKQKSWALPELKAVDGKNPGKDTLEFDLHLDKIYKWEASNAQERLLFFAVLWKLCQKYLPKQTPVFRNVPQNVLNEATQSLNADSKDGGSFDAIIPEEEYQALTEKEEHDLERLLCRTESAITNAEAFTGYLAKELSVLDGANIHSLMGSEDQVMQLLELINAAELEAAKIETRLVTYENILQQARVAKSSVGEKNISLETANNNNRKLLTELNNLVTQLDMPHQHQMALIDADLTNPVGLQNATAAAQALQRVMNAELSPGLERLTAVQDQKKRFEKWRAKFSASLARHLNNLFIHLGNDVGDTTSQSSRNSNLSIPKHAHLHTDLAPYTELMHWLKALDRHTYDELIKVYTSSLSKLYERDIRTFFEEARLKALTIKEKKVRGSDSGSENGSSGGSSSAVKRGQGTPNVGTNVQPAQQCLLGLEPELWVSDLESGDRKRLDELLECVLTELEPICLTEQEFCVTFFQLETLTNEGPVMTAKTPEKLANEEMRKIMSKLFSVLEPELLAFIATYERVDCYYSLYVLVRLGQHVMSAQDTGSFLSMAFGSALVQVKRTFDRFMQAQLKSIQESKPPRKNRCGILSFVANFAEFANTAEDIFKGSDRRVDLDKWYVRLVREMFEVIPRLANEHSKTPPEVIKMENYHRLHAMFSELKIAVLEGERKEAKQKYSEALNAYVVQYFGRPLERLNHFFDGVQAKVAQGVKESEVGYQVMFSKQELRKVISMYPGKEVKKGLDALYKKVEKHLSEESTLLQVVWREMQDLFICQYKALEDMIERCYPGALISLDFSINDILSFFSEIAISH
nr:EOG090X02H9 [Lepidurus arcticus]